MGYRGNADFKMNKKKPWNRYRERIAPNSDGWTKLPRILEPFEGHKITLDRKKSKIVCDLAIQTEKLEKHG